MSSFTGFLALFITFSIFECMNKKINVALVTFYFPPNGGAGSIRWAKLISHINPDFHFSVITPKPLDYPIYDEELSESVKGRITLCETETVRFSENEKEEGA
jgi:hypothetical protein